MRLSRTTNSNRRGAVVIIAAVLMVVFMSMVSFAVDMGYIATVQTQLQRAADASALAAAAEMNRNGLSAAITRAQQIGSLNTSSAGPISIPTSNVTFGVWNLTTRTFTPSAPGAGGNAVRVRISQTPNLFFARAMGIGNTTVNTESIAIATPRDICFVVDLSGSMNDDTETCWSTTAINNRYASAGYPTIGNTVMQDIFTDFNLGTFPGTNQQIGQGLGTFYNTYSQWGYAELTKDGGPLSASTIASTYRILTTDNETQRKTKAYSWIIDNQIKTIMPNAPANAEHHHQLQLLGQVHRLRDPDRQRYVPPPPPLPAEEDPAVEVVVARVEEVLAAVRAVHPRLRLLRHLARRPSVGSTPQHHSPVTTLCHQESSWQARSTSAAAQPSPHWPACCPARFWPAGDNLPTAEAAFRRALTANTRLVGRFNNPNTISFPGAASPTAFRNVVGPGPTSTSCSTMDET